jgi:hypothetical protein
MYYLGKKEDQCQILSEELAKRQRLVDFYVREQEMARSEIAIQKHHINDLENSIGFRKIDNEKEIFVDEGSSHRKRKEFDGEESTIKKFKY